MFQHFKFDYNKNILTVRTFRLADQNSMVPHSRRKHTQLVESYPDFSKNILPKLKRPNIMRHNFQ